jgi:hypothetical protein
MKRLRDVKARTEAFRQKMLALLSRAANIPKLDVGLQRAELHDIRRTLQELRRERDDLLLEQQHAETSNDVCASSDAVGFDNFDSMSVSSPTNELGELNDSTPFGDVWAGGR